MFFFTFAKPLKCFCEMLQTIFQVWKTWLSNLCLQAPINHSAPHGYSNERECWMNQVIPYSLFSCCGLKWEGAKLTWMCSYSEAEPKTHSTPCAVPGSRFPKNLKSMLNICFSHLLTSSFDCRQKPEVPIFCKADGTCGNSGPKKTRHYQKSCEVSRPIARPKRLG